MMLFGEKQKPSVLVYVLGAVLLIATNNALGSSGLNSVGKFCAGLNETKVKLNNGYLFPKNCTAKEVPVGSKCSIVCKKGFGYKDFSHVENECSMRNSKSTGWTAHDSYFYSTKCKSLTKCPRLDSFKKDHWWPPWCNMGPNSAGALCKPQYCPYWHEIGVKNKTCQENGSWTPVGGAYCKTDPLPFNVICPKSFTVNTDPGKATADIRGRLPIPMSTYPESEVQLLTDRGRNIKALPEHRSYLTYKIVAPLQSTRSCYFRVNVVDKEPPLVHKCPEELHFTVPAGLKLEISFDRLKDVKIVDVVDSKYGHSTDSKNSTSYHGAKVSPGNWTITYYNADSEGNKAYCKIKIRVKSKACLQNPASKDSLRIVSEDGSRFYSACPNGSISMCRAYIRRLNYLSCFNEYGFAGLTCYKYSLRPFPSCINESSLVDSVNGSCTDGAPSAYKTTAKCFPCEKSMFFNYTRKLCQICPENTTNYEVGSTSCIPCPKHQMTKLFFAPRFCEDICSPGSWLDASNSICTKCPRGSYAAPGARNCTGCPKGLTTLQMESTNITDCVVGDVTNQDSGHIQISTFNITAKNASSYLYRINTKPVDQINQLLAFKFNSSYLKQISDCLNGYVRLFTTVNSIEFGLSERICGGSLEDPIFVRVMKNQPAFVEFYFTDINSAEISFRFGVANCSLGHVFDFTSLSCKPCPVNTYRVIHNSRVCQPCKPGTAAPVEGAILCQEMCPKGSFRNGSTCVNCPIGYYQDEMEKRMCKQCPNKTSTSYSQSKNLTDCVVSCGPGEYKSGNSCLPCQPGHFQHKTKHADKMCFFCPYKKTTVGSGASFCVDECSYEGEYYNKTDSKCKKCPVGSYKLASADQVSGCTPCPTNHTTNRIGAASITECIDTYDNCSPNPCRFPGWCEDTGTSFKCHCPFLYSGQFCETKMHVCESNPCKNNATCYNYNVWSDYYYCDCPAGFTGRNCETVYHPCSSDPCYYRSNCTVVGDDFKCHCPPWHTGKRCEGAITKPCHYYPCRNRGTCTNGANQNSIPPYTCECAPDFKGKNCETQIDDCANNTCNSTGTAFCRDGVNSYHCICKAYYKSSTCSEPYGCSAGEYLSSKKCKKCEKGSYQYFRNERPKCYSCSNGQQTFREGSTSPYDCYVIKDIMKLEMTLKITNKVWSDKLLDKNSAEYVSMASKWEAAIIEIYRNESHFKAVVVDGFRKGSVVCEFNVYFQNGVKEPKEQLEKAIKSGSLKDFTVDKSSLSSVDDSGKTPPKKKKNYTLMAVLIVVGVLLVVAVVSGYLLYTRHKDRVRVRFDKMMGSETVSMEFPLSPK